MELFELATKKKYRFPYKGMITVEDLWDLSLTQLDSIYKTLNKSVKEQDGDSLMTTTADTDATNMIEIVKRVFSAKQDEAAQRKTAAENAAKKERIMQIIAKKQDDALENMDETALRKMLDDLG